MSLSPIRIRGKTKQFSMALRLFGSAPLSKKVLTSVSVRIEITKLSTALFYVAPLRGHVTGQGASFFEKFKHSFHRETNATSTF